MKTKKYKYDFSLDIKDAQKIKGLSVEVIKQISKLKNEPQWMLDIRLAAYQQFLKLPNPKFGPDLSFINFDDYYYYIKNLDNPKQTWDNVPEKIKTMFNKLGISTAEAQALSGIHSQMDSQSVYTEIINDLKKQNVLFCSMDEAVAKYPKIVKQYFTKLVSYADNKYAALNTAVWSGGSFVYVPKNTNVSKPLQAYFRINTKNAGQFERTLIIIDDNSKAEYMEGCTAPIYDKDNLHAAVVEVFVKNNSSFKYNTIQNWSDNVLNLVTKRAIVETNGTMEWVDGNIGSKINMKYPCTILKGDNSRAKCISIATAGKGVVQDSGAKMIHIGKNTNSSIISKSIAFNGGIANYRGKIDIGSNAANSQAVVTCDSFILDKYSASDTIPHEIISNSNSYIKHEAKVSNMDLEMIYYLSSRQIPIKDIEHLIIMGFIHDYTEELPMEYAVELNRLIKELIN